MKYSVLLFITAVLSTPVPANTELRAVTLTNSQPNAFPTIVGTYHAEPWRPKESAKSNLNINFNNQQDVLHRKKYMVPKWA